MNDRGHIEFENIYYSKRMFMLCLLMCVLLITPLYAADTVDTSVKSEYAPSAPPIPDTTAPVIIPLTPVSGTINVAPGSDIIFELKDFESGIKLTKLEININGEAADNNEIESIEIDNGYRVTVDPVLDLEFGAIVTVDIYIEDNKKNTANTVYSFQTSFGIPVPIISPISPLHGAADVARASDIVFKIRQFGAGIKLPKLAVNVNGAAIHNNRIESGSIADGYRVTVNPSSDFTYGSTVS
ncbi:Ig-like domain-containing protein, partial [Candidatus Margulisiibacteriota bacterium]